MGSDRSHLQKLCAPLLLCLLVPGVQLVVVGKAGTTVELQCDFPPHTLTCHPTPYMWWSGSDKALTSQ
ncbi:hypothetical protein WMY93_021945 [Mugilogobius chulae]|uniref:Uncharacterized protein n=1 Tax=Mugilogobius chulae TaxID=88201 RepID=A0AAW0NF94_9GOBI